MTIGRSPGCNCSCEPCINVFYSEFTGGRWEAVIGDFQAVGTLTEALADASPGINWEGTIEPKSTTARESYLLELELYGVFELEVEGLRIVIDTPNGSLEVGPSGASSTRYFEYDTVPPFDVPAILQVYITPDFAPVIAYEKDHASSYQWVQLLAVIEYTDTFGATGDWTIECLDNTYSLLGGSMKSRVVEYDNGTSNPPTADCSMPLYPPCPKVYYDEVFNKSSWPHVAEPTITLTGPGVYVHPSQSPGTPWPYLKYTTGGVNGCGFTITGGGYQYLTTPTGNDPGNHSGAGGVIMYTPVHTGTTPYPKSEWLYRFSFEYRFEFRVGGTLYCEYLSTDTDIGEYVPINDIDDALTMFINPSTNTYEILDAGLYDCEVIGGWPSSDSVISCQWDVF